VPNYAVFVRGDSAGARYSRPGLVGVLVEHESLGDRRGVNEVVVVIGHPKSAEVLLPDPGWARDSVVDKESNGSRVIATRNIKNR
jgi:hypothetical protein